MAALAGINTVRRTAPTYTQTGTKEGTHEAMWIVEVDDYLSGANVLFLAQTTGAAADRVPIKGAPFSWVSGTATAAINSVFALDFRVEPLFSEGEEGGKLWKITVTWRPPEQGQDEQPGTLGLDPLSRPPEYWNEYDWIPHTYAEGYPVPDGLLAHGIDGLGPFTYPASKLTRIQNAGGETFTIQGSWSLVVVVEQKNVASDVDALTLNNEFGDTVNSDEWTARGIKVKKHHAKFLRSETGPPLFESNVKYYRRQTRVAIGREPFYDRRPHVATKFIEANVPKSFINGDGTFAPNGPIIPGGTKATNQIDLDGVLGWLVHKPVPYTGILNFNR